MFYNEAPANINQSAVRNSQKMTETTKEQESKIKLNLEGTYAINGDDLISTERTSFVLRLGTRHKAKQGQAKKFIGWLDMSKPLEEMFTYISSLYSMQGLKNAYSIEYMKEHYILRMTGVNSVVIDKREQEPVLVYQPEKVPATN